MLITVALDSSRRRDIKLTAGTTEAINVAVYEKNGDTVPLTVTTATFATDYGNGPYLAVGLPFLVPDAYPGRQWYTIRGTIAGQLVLLAYGIVEIFGTDWYPMGNDYGWGPRWGYGWTSL